MQVTDEVAIQISGMNKWYGQFHVLRDINMTVQRGERIVICGPSGSGKSTLIRCINRLEEHQQGDGALTHEFEIGGVRERRMVVPYQVWMLQRLARVVRPLRETASGRQALESLLTPWPGGMRLLELDSLLAACPLRKEGGRLFSVET